MSKATTYHWKCTFPKCKCKCENPERTAQDAARAALLGCRAHPSYLQVETNTGWYVGQAYGINFNNTKS